ncbi:hypothetical protein K492DRAFT_205460 [Lichtheimia hyalospora FSU 10163]|nr:hypothetical protein K492DRAFT_205460 [Lichtheimia hyalospora FSU 10163]
MMSYHQDQHDHHQYSNNNSPLMQASRHLLPPTPTITNPNDPQLYRYSPAMTTPSPTASSFSPMRTMLPMIKSSYTDEPAPLYGSSPLKVEGVELDMMMKHHHLIARSSISSGCSSSLSSVASSSPTTTTSSILTTSTSRNNSDSINNHENLITLAKRRAREYDIHQEQSRMRVWIQHDHEPSPLLPPPPPPPSSYSIKNHHDKSITLNDCGTLMTGTTAGAGNSGNASHPCSQCTHRFRRRRDLMRHLHSVHSRRKQYNCPLCCSTFTRRDSLKRHARLACRANIASSRPHSPTSQPASLPSPSTSPTLDNRNTHHHPLVSSSTLQQSQIMASSNNPMM